MMGAKILARWQYRLSSIKAQLILGFALILVLALIIAIIGFVSLRNLQVGVETTFEEANRVRELSLEIENDFLLARQSEANFLESWPRIGYPTAQVRFVVPNQQFLTQAHQKLDEINELIATSNNPDFQLLLADTQALKPLLNQYQLAFLAVVAQVQERSEANGLDRKLQQQLATLGTQVDPLVRLDLDRIILEIKANEQAFFNTHNRQNLDNVYSHILEFKHIVEKSREVDLTGGGQRLQKADLIDQIQAYNNTLDKLVELQEKAEINSQTFREVTEQINQITNRLDQAAVKVLEIARGRLEQVSSQSTSALLFTAMLALGLAGMAAWFLTRRITQPLRQLSRAAQHLGKGQLEQRAEVSGPREFAMLARVFNDMASQLENMVESLEERVESRTRRLALVAALGEKLNAILDQQELLNEVIQQINLNFGYYYATICLFDEKRENLFFATGTGEIGQQLLASGFRIPLDHTKSLIAKAARTGEVVWENDLTATDTWLQIDVLPNTRAEMCVPIFEEEQVVGVLDVQADRVGVLDEGDASLLRSLANQLGVAMHNARLYTIAQQELKERQWAEAALQEANLQLKERAIELEQKKVELEQQALELAQSKETAEGASRAKSEFLASMSHELRTPLHGVLGYTQILSMDPDLTAQQQAQLHIIRRSGEHLLTLMNDILDLSRIEVHKMELQPSQFYFKPFLEKIFEMCRFRGEDKGLEIRFEVVSALPVAIFTDEKRLRQALVNLLGNAVKFTEKGFVVFRVNMVSVKEPSNQNDELVMNREAVVRFEIEDSGIGISPLQIEKIFLPFQQVKGGRDQSDGAGLGLTISQRFVQMLGGELYVKSELGVGSIFWFEIPLSVMLEESSQKAEPIATPQRETLSETVTPLSVGTHRLVAPSPDILGQWLELISMGDFHSLEDEVNQLCQNEIQFKPFGAKLLELASQFEEEEMIALLETYRGTSA